MGRDGKKNPKPQEDTKQVRGRKKGRLKPYRKKHVNHRSQKFWKEYNDGLDAFTYDEEE
ncbi:MAG: hypothetical protein R3275_05885 [Saprospiraceae bacterium]|nr:hypothetical protein [Saprospiraceae bacterium]